MQLLTQTCLQKFWRRQIFSLSCFLHASKPMWNGRWRYVSSQTGAWLGPKRIMRWLLVGWLLHAIWRKDISCLDESKCLLADPSGNKFLVCSNEELTNQPRLLPALQSQWKRLDLHRECIGSKFMKDWKQKVVLQWLIVAWPPLNHSIDHWTLTSVMVTVWVCCHIPIHNCLRFSNTLYMYDMDVGCSLKGSTASTIA